MSLQNITQARHNQYLSQGYTFKQGQQIYFRGAVYDRVSYSKDAEISKRTNDCALWIFCSLATCCLIPICCCEFNRDTFEVAFEGRRVIRGAKYNQQASVDIYEEICKDLGCEYNKPETYEAFLKKNRSKIHYFAGHAFLPIRSPKKGISVLFFIPHQEFDKAEFHSVWDAKTGKAYSYEKVIEYGRLQCRAPIKRPETNSHQRGIVRYHTENNERMSLLEAVSASEKI